MRWPSEIIPALLTASKWTPLLCCSSYWVEPPVNYVVYVFSNQSEQLPRAPGHHLAWSGVTTPSD